MMLYCFLHCSCLYQGSADDVLSGVQETLCRCEKTCEQSPVFCQDPHKGTTCWLDQVS